MSKIICFGELMLRLMPEGYGRFLQAKTFDAEFGGAEANVAVSLANFGANAAFVTCLPKNPLGDAALNSLRRYGVDVSYIVRNGERLGIYFLEKGASQRPSLCIYDRKNSAFSQSQFSDYDWKKIFSGATRFHITGVTPSLSKNCHDISVSACKMAKDAGLKISCDLNYRSRLWTKQKARRVMSEIAKYIELCIANEDDLQNVFGITVKNANIDAGIVNAESYQNAILAAVKKFGFKQVAVTLRRSVNASENFFSAIFFDGKNFFKSREYKIQIVERVGSGDAFAAGLIFALEEKCAPQEALNFAVAASCLKHSIEGDFNLVTKEEVLALVRSSGTGRVLR